MPQEILDFWFSQEVRKLWFKSTPEFDALLRDRYREIWEQARRGEFEHWVQNPAGCLALVITLDQFPLNMFRGQALAYSTEAQSRNVARTAIQQNFDRLLEAEQRAFLYMPFMHSEELTDQQRSLELFAQPGLESNLRFARHHHDLIEKFGRFPHRNEALGRDNSAAEIDYLNSKQAFTG